MGVSLENVIVGANALIDDAQLELESQAASKCYDKEMILTLLVRIKINNTWKNCANEQKKRKTTAPINKRNDLQSLAFG